MISLKLCTVSGLMVLTIGLLQMRGDVDKVPASQPLNGLPAEIGLWRGTDVALDDEVLQVLGKGVFLNRVYQTAGVSGKGGQSRSLELFIGYFPTQRTGQAIHSPQNCLPGAGWVFESSGVTELKGQAATPLRVGDYLISNGVSKEEVLYWYRSHGRSMASDYVAKLYTLLDSIRYNRTDAALIRIAVPLFPGESREAVHQRAVKFAEELSPLLPAYIPD